MRRGLRALDDLLHLLHFSSESLLFSLDLVLLI